MTVSVYGLVGPLVRGGETALNKMLSSWKEIAHFFGKGVRTVQRWEKTLDLPIRRPPGAPSNVVLARTSDLEAWMHRGPGKVALAVEGSGADEQSIALLRELEREVQMLIVQAGGKAPAGDGVEGASLNDRLQNLLRDIDSSGVRVEHRLRKVA